MTPHASGKDVSVHTDYLDTSRRCFFSLSSNFVSIRSMLMPRNSFVDCPGHDILMSTMLSGAAVMDAALLLIAGNETCPQPQTSEHLAAIEIMKLGGGGGRRGGGGRGREGAAAARERAGRKGGRGAV